MDMIKSDSQLPVTIEELHNWLIVGKEKLKAHKAKIRAIEKVDSAQVAKEAALNDAQDLADILLDAEAKLGEMLAAIDKTPSRVRGSTRGTTVRPTLPEGITKKESHHAQTVAKNPSVVAAVKQQAREEGKLATAREVVKEVKKRKAKGEPQTKKEGQPPTSSNAMSFADKAINQLKRIHPEDPGRSGALMYVEIWIKNNKRRRK
jgi:hypothetical protein